MDNATTCPINNSPCRSSCAWALWLNKNKSVCAIAAIPARGTDYTVNAIRVNNIREDEKF